MSRDIAETLRGIARERRSSSSSPCASRGKEHRAASDSRGAPGVHADRDARGGWFDIDGLIKKSAGGYLVIPEISRARRCPATSGARRSPDLQCAKDVSLAATLHADGPDDASRRSARAAECPTLTRPRSNSSFTCVRSADGRNRHAASSSRSTRSTREGRQTDDQASPWVGRATRPLYLEPLIDLSPLRESRSFRLLWFGQLVSLSGTQLRLVAIPYQIYLLRARRSTSDSSDSFRRSR